MLRASQRLVIAALFLPLQLMSAQTRAAGPAPFQPDAATDLRRIEARLRAVSPALHEARLAVEEARFGVVEAGLFPNPELDVTWGTVPIGRTPEGAAERPFARVPSYEAGLSWTLEVGKRGPRRDARAAEVRAREAELEREVRGAALGVARALGAMAVGSLRSHGATELARQTESALGVLESRFQGQAAAGLDVDRLRLELARTRLEVEAARGAVERARGECGLLVGGTCGAFESVAEARRFLERWTRDAAERLRSPLGRPDLVLATRDAERAAAEARLARARRIPDPTLRVAYLHDRFLGNQQNSVSLGATIPLPLLDDGGVRARAAEARRDRALAQRTRLQRRAESLAPLLRERIRLGRERQHRLEVELVPAARAVVERLERVLESRLVTLAEVVAARRALAELLLEEAGTWDDLFDAAIDLETELPTSAPRAESRP